MIESEILSLEYSGRHNPLTLTFARGEPGTFDLQDSGQVEIAYGTWTIVRPTEGPWAGEEIVALDNVEWRTNPQETPAGWRQRWG